MNSIRSRSRPPQKHLNIPVFFFPPLQLSVCKELQLPDSEYNYTADLVAVTSAAPLEAASVQAISVLAVSAEGTARLWPSLAQEGNYTETDVDLGDLCNFVVAVRVSTSDLFLICFFAAATAEWLPNSLVLLSLACHQPWFTPSL